MLETQEKSMQNSMTEESMQMNDSMNEMEATPKIKMEMTPQEAISGLIKNQIIVLDEELDVAKKRYADADLNDENWLGKYERKIDCKVLNGQISILNKLHNDFESIFPSMAM